MTANSLRLGLAAFVLLAAAAITNMLMLQPHGGRSGGGKPSPGAVKGAAAARPDTAQRASHGETAAAAATTATASGTTSGTAAALAPAAAPATPASTATQDVTRAIQRELKERGYEPGTADGQPGLMTRAAIMAYEHDRNLPLTAEPTSQLLKTILMSSAPVAAAPRGAAGVEQSMHATQVIRTVQQSLVTLGYVPGKVDGRLGDDTVRAIRDFETDQGMPESGRVSGQLVARLSRLAGQGRLTTGR